LIKPFLDVGVRRRWRRKWGANLRARRCRLQPHRPPETCRASARMPARGRRLPSCCSSRCERACARSARVEVRLLSVGTSPLGVVGNAQFVQLFMLARPWHRCVTMPSLYSSADLPRYLRLDVGAKVRCAWRSPHEERLAGFVLLLDEAHRRLRFLVHGLHALLRQRPVSSIFWPPLPSAAHEWITPRGPNLLQRGILG